MDKGIHYIHGTGNKSYDFGVAGLIPDNGELSGNNAKISKRFFNYALLTEGEFEAMLLREILSINQVAYTDPRGIYQQGIDTINDMLYSGLHRSASSFTGAIPNELNKVLSKLKKSIRKTNPAGKVIAVNDKFRIGIGMGFDPNGSPIQEIDCGPTPNLNSTLQYIQQWNKCKQQNEDIRLLNQNFPDSGHYLMYAHDKNLEYSNNALYITKSQFHKSVLEAISINTNLSQSNLLDWSRYGVKLRNHNDGLEAIEPEEYLLRMRAAGLAYQLGWKDGDPTSPVGVGLDPITGVIILVGIGVTALITSQVLASKAESKRMDFVKEYNAQMALLGADVYTPNQASDFINSYSASEVQNGITTLSSLGIIATTGGGGSGSGNTNTGGGSGNNNNGGNNGGGNNNESSTNNNGLILGGVAALAAALIFGNNKKKKS